MRRGPLLSRTAIRVGLAASWVEEPIPVGAPILSVGSAILEGIGIAAAQQHLLSDQSWKERGLQSTTLH